MIPPDELARLRADVEALTLPETVQVFRKTLTRDNEGGWTETWPVVATCPGALSPSGLTPQEREIAARIGAPLTWNVRVPVSSDIRPTDRVAVLGHLLNVVAVLGPRTLEITRKLICTEVSE